MWCISHCYTDHWHIHQELENLKRGQPIVTIRSQWWQKTIFVLPDSSNGTYSIPAMQVALTVTFHLMCRDAMREWELSPSVAQLSFSRYAFLSNMWSGAWNKRKLTSEISNRFLPSSVGRVWDWWSGCHGFKPHWGQFLMKFFLCCVTSDLSDNLTEMCQISLSWKTRMPQKVSLG